MPENAKIKTPKENVRYRDILINAQAHISANLYL